MNILEHDRALNKRNIDEYATLLFDVESNSTIRKTLQPMSVKLLADKFGWDVHKTQCWLETNRIVDTSLSQYGDHVVGLDYDGKARLLCYQVMCFASDDIPGKVSLSETYGMYDGDFLESVLNKKFDGLVVQLMPVTVKQSVEVYA